MTKAESLKYLWEIRKRAAKERYSYLRFLGWPDNYGFVGKHPELDTLIQEILDDAVMHGIIDKIPVSKKDLE